MEKSEPSYLADGNVKWCCHFREQSGGSIFFFLYEIKLSLPVLVGEGKGNPLQDSCLENAMDTGAWRATVHSQRVRHN